MKASNQTSYPLHICITPEGVRVPMLLDPSGLPLTLPLRWVVQWRVGRVDCSSICSDLYCVGLLWHWGKEAGIDIDERLANGFWSEAEIRAFALWLRQRRGLVGSRVAVDTYNSYLGKVAGFARWCAEYLHDHSTNLEQRDFATRAGDAAAKLFLRHKIRATSKRSLVGLTDEQLQRLLSVIDPSSAENPFPSSSAFANAVVVRTLAETGMRRGELLSLRVSNVQLWGDERVLEIRSIADDPADPRPIAPSAKTGDRRIPISASLAALLGRYEREVRAGARHDFFFVAVRSLRPMDPRFVNRIFEGLQKPTGIPTLAPHGLVAVLWSDHQARCFGNGWCVTRLSAVLGLAGCAPRGCWLNSQTCTTC